MRLNKKEHFIRFGLLMTAGLLGVQLAVPVAQILAKPEVASLLVYLETGRVVKLQLEPPQETSPPDTATEAPIPEREKLTFAPQDAGLIQVSYSWNCQLDIPTMLLSELKWDLTEQNPTVLILHSHATESYTQTADAFYEASSYYRTLDEAHNMLRVGQALAEALEAHGIGVIHDTTLHDHPSYTDAYIRSRETVQKYLEAYPTIALVLDLHRDAAEMDGGGQLSTHAQVNGRDSAQIMLVVGSNAGGRIHPRWQENMALALKLQTALEKRHPGLCRPIVVRTERFNQDLSSGALLVEIGAAGDTLEEALQAAEALAEGIYDLSLGTVTEYSTS